jgi:hypothetical protein
VREAPSDLALSLYVLLVAGLLFAVLATLKGWL